MASTLDILKCLSEHRVQYVLIGGMACVIHGSQVVTRDVAICAPLTLKNLSAICEALKDFHPRFRMSIDLRPLPANPEELVDFKNLYLVTDLGQLDILSEVAGVGEFPDVEKHSIPMDLAAVPILVLDLETLILAKGIMNTPKDRQVVIELSAIRERLRDIDNKAAGTRKSDSMSCGHPKSSPK